MKTELKDRSRLERMVIHNMQQTTPHEEQVPWGEIIFVIVLAYCLVMVICSL